MLNQELMEALRRLEIEQGFVAAFDALWSMFYKKTMQIDAESLAEEMQRWHLLYGEEYEALCDTLGIDFKRYEVE